MKSFTDLEQSKELAKILPLESADMYYLIKRSDCRVNWEEAAKDDTNVILFTKEMMSGTLSDYRLPCWSLAPLIDILPVDWWGYSEHYFLEISKMGDATKPNEVRYFSFRKEIDGANYDRITHISHSAENLVDACVNMIITLHDHKLLSIK